MCARCTHLLSVAHVFENGWTWIDFLFIYSHLLGADGDNSENKATNQMENIIDIRYIYLNDNYWFKNRCYCVEWNWNYSTQHLFHISNAKTLWFWYIVIYMTPAISNSGWLDSVIQHRIQLYSLHHWTHLYEIQILVITLIIYDFPVN